MPACKGGLMNTGGRIYGRTRRDFARSINLRRIPGAARTQPLRERMATAATAAGYYTHTDVAYRLN